MSDIFFALSKPAWIKGFRKMLNADIGGRPCPGRAGGDGCGCLILRKCRSYSLILLPDVVNGM